jgi:tetratricopeptide (TPR) repeat protein
VWRRGLEVRPGDPRAEAEGRRLRLLAKLDTEGAEADRDATTLAEVGRLYRAGGETEKAMVYLRRAVAADPGTAGLWRDLAASYVDAGRYPEAIGALAEGLARSPAPADEAAMEQTLARLKLLVSASRLRAGG